MKKCVRILLAGLIVAAVLAAGLAGAYKLYSMYRNVWLRLDAMYELNKELKGNLRELDGSIRMLDQKVEHLHRNAFFSGDVAETEFDDSWAESVPPYIAHAFGGVDGYTYTNSREAFLANYELGQRVFEVDFNLSEDGVLIASHTEEDWRRMTGAELPYTSENFRQYPLYDLYEPLTAAEVIGLMAEYPDIYLVTDTKDQVQDKVMLAFSQLVYCAKQTEPAVLDRIIPQIYNEEMLSWISGIHPFRSVIYTLYATQWSPESVLDFCMNSGVRFITVPVDLITPDIIRLWDTMGIRTAVHTVNDAEQAEGLFEMGVDLIYTDFLCE